MGLREDAITDGLGLEERINHTAVPKTEKEKVLSAADRMIDQLDNPDTDLNKAVSNQHWWSARSGEIKKGDGKNVRYVRAKYGGKAIDMNGDHVKNDKASIKAHIIKLRAFFNKKDEKDFAHEKKARVKK
jgi:hypothetical protein